MADLSDLKRGQIVGARMSDVSVTKPAELFSVAMSTVLKVMSAFEKERKTFSQKKNSGRKWKLSDKDCQTLTQIVRKNTTPKITAELNDHLENPVCSKMVRKQLQKAGFHGRAAIWKPFKNRFVWKYHVFPLFCPNPIYIYIYVCVCVCACVCG